MREMRILLCVVVIALLSFLCNSSFALITYNNNDNNDPQRPQYHFQPPSNWMNDPNGPVYYKGVYHLFYQYNPHAAVWGDMHWGHAISKDLVHWTHLPVAVAPTPGSYDTNGIFSGSITVTNNPTTPLLLVYTGIPGDNSEVQCLAFPTDINDPTLTNWTKYSGNPVVPKPPMGGTTGFRDPTTAWFAGGSWYLTVGSGLPAAGMALLYTSKDLLRWDYVHTLYDELTVPILKDDNMWECPDFFQTGSVHVLKFSGNGRDIWNVGQYNTTNNKFVKSGSAGLYDFGRFYASKSFFDSSKNRQVLFGWVSEEDNNATARGWAGMMSLPRIISIDPNTMFVKTPPIPELTLLRGNQYSFPNVRVGPSQAYPLSGLAQGQQVEIQVTLNDVDDAVTSYGLIVRASSKEYTTISFNYGTPSTQPEYNTDRPGGDYHYHPLTTFSPSECMAFCSADPMCLAWTVYTDQSNVIQCTLKNVIPDARTNTPNIVSGVRAHVTTDMSQSSISSDTNKGIRTMPVIGKLQSLRVFIDHSVIEVYVNEGTSVSTSRIYPALPESQGIQLFSHGGTIDATAIVWDMKSSW